MFKYRLRWNAENNYDELNYVTPKKITQLPFFYEHFTTGNRLVCSREMTSQLAACASHKYNRNNYYIRPYLDARWFFFHTGAIPPPREKLKLVFLPPFFYINKLYGNVDSALKFTQNDIINF